MKVAGKTKIIFHHLEMSFKGDGKASDLPVLIDFQLEVRDGEFVCIVGPSGCGKTTLLNAAAGFLPPGSGEIRIDGVPVTAPDSRRIFIFQENSIFPWLTVEENIGFGVLQGSEKQKQETVSHYVEMIGLRGFEHSYPNQLSGGMKQRVEIARALSANPDILFMDEPFGSLDFITRMRMRRELIQIWKQERKTILFVTHDVEESVQLADRVVPSHGLGFFVGVSSAKSMKLKILYRYLGFFSARSFLI